MAGLTTLAIMPGRQYRLFVYVVSYRDPRKVNEMAMKGSLGSGTESGNASQRVENAAKAAAAQPSPAPAAPPPAPAPQPTNSTPPASSKTAHESAFFKNVDRDKPTGESKASEEAKQQAAVESKKRRIKADGKEVEFDFSNEAEVERHVKLGLSAPRVFSERDRLAKAYAETQKKQKEMETELGKYKQAIEKIEAASGDDEALFRLITGGRELKDIVKKYQDRDRWLENASPDEIEKYKLEQRVAMIEAEKRTEAQRREKAEAEQKKSAEQMERSRYENEKSAIKQQFDIELSKVTSGDAEVDEAIYFRANRIIQSQWKALEDRLARTEEGTAEWLRLRQIVEGGLPKSLISKAFKQASDSFKSKIGSKVEETVRASEDKATKSATEQAQLASTKNYGSPATLEDEIAKFKGRPTELWGRNGIFKSK